MSDRTILRLWVYDCPDSERPAVLAVTGTYGLGLEYEDETTWIDPFYAYEISVGTGIDIRNALREDAPGASFLLIEYPGSLFLGDVYAYTPALGDFHAECNHEGKPAYTAGQITGMIREAGIGRHADDLLAALERQMGQPWFDDWHAHTQAEAAIVAGTGQETGQ